MAETKDNILVWLPSPMGDAILCTPALRAIRKKFASAKITFFASAVVRHVLSPCGFTDAWLEQNNSGVFTAAQMLRRNRFTHVIMFKNSFGSAITSWLAGIPVRVGYARDGRGILLSDKLYPPRLASGNYKPISIVDYYLAVAAKLGADISDRSIELAVEPADTEKLKGKLPAVFSGKGPLVILVPGAAAGPSKRWSAGRFAQVADLLAEKYNATVVLSIAPNADEKHIAEHIADAAKHKPINLGDTPVGLGELKALIARANLVICNDTGPRHIAIGLKRKVITLVGPNNPEWTDPGYADETFIKGNAPCAPCDKPVCRESSHFCMEAVTTNMVCTAAAKVLDRGGL
jgi:heptosyltransferase II